MAFDKGVDSLKGAANELAEGAKALGGAVKDMSVGGKNVTKGTIGGIVGFAGGVVETAMRAVGVAGKAAGKLAQAFPKLTAFTALAVGAVAVKNWDENRTKKKHLALEEKKGELLSTALANHGLESQMNAGAPASSDGRFDNPEARADFVQRYASPEARQSAAQNYAR